LIDSKKISEKKNPTFDSKNSCEKNLREESIKINNLEGKKLSNKV